MERLASLSHHVENDLGDPEGEQEEGEEGEAERGGIDGVEEEEDEKKSGIKPRVEDCYLLPLDNGGYICIWC